MLDVPFLAKLLGVCDGARGGTRGGESCACLPYNAQYQIYKEEIMAHRVLYYVCDGKTDAAELVLAGIEGGDQIELMGCAHKPFVCPTAEQLRGCSGFIGEFGPVFGDAVDAVASAGVQIVSSMSIGLNHIDVAGLTARGPVVDEAALLHALDEYAESGGERGICAAGLDVLDDETAPNRALIEHPRCVVTPHTAYCTAEANDTLRRMTLQAVVDKLVFGREPQNVVRV